MSTPEQLLALARDDASILELIDSEPAPPPAKRVRVDKDTCPHVRFGDETMRVVTRHASALTRLLVCAVRLGEEVTLDFTPSELVVAQQSSCKSATIYMTVPTSSFAVYSVPKSRAFTIGQDHVRDLGTLTKAEHWLEFAEREHVEPDRLLVRLVDSVCDSLFRIAVNTTIDASTFALSLDDCTQMASVELDAKVFDRLLKEAERIKSLRVELSLADADTLRFQSYAERSDAGTNRHDIQVTVEGASTRVAEPVFDASYSLITLRMLAGFATQVQRAKLWFGAERGDDMPLTISFTADTPLTAQIVCLVSACVSID